MRRVARATAGSRKAPITTSASRKASGGSTGMM
ncbi:Uncharacterised protein [Bordetella pertussis]|nr:Uncharacterised protein [Bordetella pertussis]CPQ13190.1 Uncharacterised protein [Bordetella pertussis]CRE33605.1 Uncharacterised protein [Bordetella pertussis]